MHWHPFSIASGPDASGLEFYIEVFKDIAWTGQLWHMLKKEGGNSGGTSLKQINIEVMGPYGTSSANTQKFSHALAIGAVTGTYNLLPIGVRQSLDDLAAHNLRLFLFFETTTGIVPALSLFKQHVRQLMRLDPANYFIELERHQEKVRRVERA